MATKSRICNRLIVDNDDNFTADQPVKVPK